MYLKYLVNIGLFQDSELGKEESQAISFGQPGQQQQQPIGDDLATPPTNSVTEPGNQATKPGQPASISIPPPPNFK